MGGGEGGEHYLDGSLGVSVAQHHGQQVHLHQVLVVAAAAVRVCAWGTVNIAIPVI